MRIVLALVLLSWAFIAAKGSHFLQGDERWLASEKCSFPDAEQCASEKVMKDMLRQGPIRVETID